MPAGWVPKPTAPVRFNLGNAGVALLTGQPDSWLANWIYLLETISFDTADFCTAVDLTAPALTAEDFISLIPLQRPTWMSTALQVGVTAFQLRDKLMAYMQARVGAAYCQLPGTLTGGYGSYYTATVASTHGSFGDDQKIIVCAVPPLATSCIPGIISKSGSVSNVVMYAAQDTWTNPSTLVLAGTAIGDDAPKSLGAAGTYKQIWGWIDGGPGSAVVRIKFNVATPIVQTPTMQAVPANLPPPSSGTYASYADLGAELDRQEHKLDLIRDLLTYLIDLTWKPAQTADDAETVTEDPVEVETITGVIVHVDSIPPGISQTFGSPARYKGLGTISLGTADGWLPPVDISQNPMVVLGIPPTVVNVAINITPPATGTYKLLH